MRVRQSLVLGLIALSVLAGKALAAPLEVHYAPVENLERIDVGLLQVARSKIDMAAYSLTDWPVIDALIDDWGDPSEDGAAREKSRGRNAQGDGKGPGSRHRQDDREGDRSAGPSDRGNTRQITPSTRSASWADESGEMDWREEAESSQLTPIYGAKLMEWAPTESALPTIRITSRKARRSLSRQTHASN